MEWTTLVGIMLVPVGAMLLRIHCAEPLERFAQKHLPKRWADLLTKEYGDRRDGTKRKRDV
jgi:hypothetical protein